jgi:hypothetical protein
MANTKEIKLMFEEYLESNSLELKVRVKTKSLIFKEEHKERNNYLIYSFDNRGGCLFFENGYTSLIELKPIENIFRKVHKNNGIKQSIYHTVQSGVYYTNLREKDVAFEGLSAIHLELQESIKNGMQFWKEFDTVEKIRKNVNQLHPETELYRFLRSPCHMRKLGILALTNDPEFDKYREYTENWYAEIVKSKYALQYEDEKFYLAEILNEFEKLKTDENKV